MSRSSFAVLALIPALLFAAPALAQDTAGAPAGDERINQLIVYGNDVCPQSTEDEITVCARKGEGERFRIPEPLRGIDSPQSEAWNNKVVAYETVAATGTLSCSPVGAGGSLGCTQRLINQAYAEKANGSDVRFGPLIEAERAKRLSTIDTDAAETQARVEVLEKQYEDRRKREEETPPVAVKTP